MLSLRNQCCSVPLQSFFSAWDEHLYISFFYVIWILVVAVDGVVYERIASILLAHLLTSLELILQNIDKIAECEDVEQGRLGFESRLGHLLPVWSSTSYLA